MSRLKLLVRSCPVVVAHSLPATASWFRFSPCASPFTPLFTRSRFDQLGTWVVVALSVSGGLNLFDCLLELASQVCRVLRFSQA